MRLVPALAFLALSLLGCDSTDIVTPSGPESLQVDMTARFDDDLVRIELDGQRIYQERLTTNDVLSYAGGARFELPEGLHRLRVEVVGRASAAADFQAGEIVFVSVHFDPDQDDISLWLSDEVFCCYD